MQSVHPRFKLLDIYVQPAFGKPNVDCSFKHITNCNIIMGKICGKLATTFSQNKTHARIPQLHLCSSLYVRAAAYVIWKKLSVGAALWLELIKLVGPVGLSGFVRRRGVGTPLGSNWNLRLPDPISRRPRGLVVVVV